MVLPRRLSLWVTLSMCLQGTTSVDPSKKVSVKEVVFDSAVADIQWMGDNHLTVLCQTLNGRLYRSTSGGDSWDDISDQLKVDWPASAASNAVIVDSMIVSKADSSTVMIVGTKSNHFLSVNAGATWRRVRHRAKIHTFMFHKTRPKWALLSSWTDSCETPSSKKKDMSSASTSAVSGSTTAEGTDDASGPCNHMLYLTKDLGRTFTLVTSYAVQFSWGPPAVNQQDRVYFTHFRQKKGDQPKLSLWSRMVDFAYTDDGGSKVTRLVYRGNKFLVSSSYIFVAKLKEQTAQTVNLMVSSDGGAHFSTAKLPQELEEKSYTVLDTSEGAVVLHVNHGSKGSFGVGNVYVSDGDGIRYALSLPNNIRSSGGDCEFDKVLSLDGVYLANFGDIQRSGDSTSGEDTTAVQSKQEQDAKEADDIEKSATSSAVDKKRSVKAKGKDESIVRTVISFDKGGIWSYLKPPKVDSTGKQIDCPPERCWLHLHGVTNFRNYAPFYSTENAIGIVMGTGNVGPYLRFEPDQTNTYFSRDGGLSWVEAHKGAFIYEIGDHGGLLLMADDIKKTKQVIFSWNEGQSWYDFQLSDTPIEVDNIVTEPNATSTKFLLYGTRGDSGVLYYLDFDALGQPLCKGVWAADSVSSDYETWTPTDGRSADKCILGRQISYTRRKATSECFNGEKFERPVTRKNCACTEENFDCEMGFARKIGGTECKLVDDQTGGAVPEKCTTSDFYYVDAYRKVVGDTCQGGWTAAMVPVPCPAGSKFSRGAVSVLFVIFMVAIVMASVTYLSRSEKFKGWFANYGFESFNSVKYAHIGKNAPETALDSVGTRYDTDFIEAEQDEFNDDAPELMHYAIQGNDREDVQMRNENVRRIDTAVTSVPRLQAPPGPQGLPTTANFALQPAGPAGGSEDDTLDLL